MLSRWNIWRLSLKSTFSVPEVSFLCWFTWPVDCHINKAFKLYGFLLFAWVLINNCFRIKHPSVLVNINMESLQQYESSSSDSDFHNDELSTRQVRQVYLVTYSQADTSKFPTRKLFAEAVVLSFSRGTTTSVVHWCCSHVHRKGMSVLVSTTT